MSSTIVDMGGTTGTRVHVTWRDLVSAAPGLILEFGVFRGASFRQICDAASPRIVHGFDSFRGLEEDWRLPHYPKGTFDRQGEAPPNIRENGRLIVGRVEETLVPFLARHPGQVAFAHFDMDLYAPTKFALKALAWRFVTGSILLFDEWTIGDDERRAFLEFKKETGHEAEFIGARNAHSWAFQIK